MTIVVENVLKLKRKKKMGQKVNPNGTRLAIELGHQDKFSGSKYSSATNKILK